MIELTCVVPVIWLNSHFCWLQTNLTRKTFSHVVLHSWMLNYWPKLIFASRMNFALIVLIDCASICWAQFKLNVFECGWTMKRGKYADLQSRSPKLIWVHTSKKVVFAVAELRRQLEFSAERLSDNAKTIKITQFTELLTVISP